MNAREEWLLARRAGLGGTDMAAVLGLSRYKTQVDLFLEKTGQAEDRPMTPAMEMGIEFEPVIANWYQEHTGNKVQRINQLIRHPGKPFLIANIDRAVVVDGSRARLGTTGELLGAQGILEVKTATAFKNSEWGADDDDEAVPMEYTIQAMHYLSVTGMEWCDIACYVLGSRKVIKRIERDDETIRGMVERAEEFWFKHIVEGIPPEPKDGDDAIKLFPRDSGRSIEANPKTLELLSRAVELKQQIAALELELDGDRKKGINGVMGELKAYMADASAITIGSETLATWKAQTAQRLDTTAFKAAHPDIYQQFLKASESRVFRIK